MNHLNNAKYIKALFLDNLINKKIEGMIVGSEVMFAHKKVVADLVLLMNGNINAFEIKAKNDDFRKIIAQLEEYNKVFDTITVIITENHLEKAKRMIPNQVGIIIINNDLQFEIYRESKTNINLNKEEIISTMTIKFIVKYYNIPIKKRSAQEIRKSLEVNDILDLKKSLHKFFYQRIVNKFNNFLSERGNKTHYEDVIILSMPEKRISL